MKKEQGERNGLKRKAIIAMLLMLAVLIFVALTQSKSVQEMITKAQEQMRYALEETSDTVTREVGITSIDLTGLVTGDDVNHTHIYEKKYDDNYHWEECWICGKKESTTAHTLTYSGSPDCGYQGDYVQYCTECGYSKTLPKNPHANATLVSQANIYEHQWKCPTCWKNIDRGFCVNESGQRLGCSTGLTGTCTVCGYNYTSAGHRDSFGYVWMYEEDDSNRGEAHCNGCDMLFSTFWVERTVLDTNTTRVLFKIQLENGVTFKDYSLNTIHNRFESCNSSMTGTNESAWYDGTYYYYQADVNPNSEQPRQDGDVHIHVPYYINDIYCGTIHYGVNVYEDNYAPIKNNITVDGNGTVNNYSQKATITATYVDEWNSPNNLVYMRLIDKDKNTVISDWDVATKNGTTYTKTFDIVAEIREPSNVYIQVRDASGNTTTLEDGAVTVQYIDAKAPSLTNTEEDHTSQWSKNKQVRFDAQDLGVGGVQIAFNNVNDYQGANQEGDNYTRTYNFYGEVYDKVTAAIYLKDALGNEQVVKVDIGKLDGTAPTITKAELNNKIIEIEANDRHETLGEGSGVVGYRYVTSLEDNGTQITEDSGTYTEESQIDISNMSKIKYVYIAPVDAVGNIGKTVKVELPTYSYTVNYYEEGTETKIANSKVVEDKAIGEEIEETAIEVEGYNAVAPTTQTIEIKENGNEINFYYTKRNDLSYTVKYLEQGTNKKLQEEKTVNNRTYKEVIEERAIDIAGYKIEGENTQSIEIGVGINEIIFYYSKRTDIEYRVEYYYDGVKDESKTEVYTGTYEEQITEYEEKITEKYELEKVENLPLTIGVNEEENVIKVWYVRKEARVIVHHYIQGTTDKISADVVINGQVDDVYNTTEAQDIPANYECVGKTNNTNGNMTLEEIEVIYYYQLKEAQINNDIEMTGPEKLTEEEGEVQYTISSNVEVNTYIGNVKITIVATLPYEIDETKSNLNGGVYNSADKTITWEETIQNVNTFIEGAEEINREKTITVVYKNIDYSKTSFEAKSETKVELETPKQENTTESVTVTTQTEFTKEIEVTKVWNHTNNIYGIPQEVKIQVKNEEEIVAEKVLNSSNKVNNDENIWTWTFTELAKYNEQGKEINYTVDEVKEGNLNYYEGKIEYTEEIQDVQKVKITNTYKGAVITSEKTATAENGLSYVLEGEKITYTIKVQNNGDLEQDVVVKDNIPEGTSFVAGSIKVNGVADASKTETDLSNGIRVNVSARTDEDTPGEITVSFEVIVNTLGENVFTKDIKNAATVNKNPDNPDSTDEPTNEVTTIVNKSDLKYSKEATPKTGSTVKVGDEITYTIHLGNSKGTAPTSAIVKDTIPTGTTFVKDSIVVGGQAQVGKTADDLASGIKVDLAARESKDVVFKVTVNNLNNGDKIRNVATVNDNPTNETEHTYTEAIITANKEVTTENSLSYVVEGEKITYTIKIQNSGDLEQDVVVKDNIPEGTSFVTGSIKVNGVADASKTETDLKDGIRVTVPARENEQTRGEIAVSFETTVNEVTGTESRTIKNVARINKNPDAPESKDEETNGTDVPVLVYNKKAEIIKADIDKENNNNIREGAVTAGDRIKYTVTIQNVGEEAIRNVEIKDTVPEGTTIYQINDDGEISLNAGNVITWNVAEIAGGEVKEVSFEVTVDYDNEGKTIKNVATVDGKETNGVETTYEVPEVDLSSSVEKTGPEKITSTEEKISYTIRYRAEIGEFVGKGKIKIVDYLPYEIDEANSEIAGGTYNKEEKTITWEEDLGEIDTYTENITEIERTKTITVKYIYPDEENLSGIIENRVEGGITLSQKKNPDDPEEVIEEETKGDRQEVQVEIPAKVIVHHYIYDEIAGGETKIKVPSKEGGVVEEEAIEGIIGQNYNTSASDKIDENYECIDTTPENAQGKMTKKDIEVTYYYKLKEAQLGAGIEKTATTSKMEEREYETGKVDEQGKPIMEKKIVPIITTEKEEITYEIGYRMVISSYKGKVNVTIVDKLPAEIDIEDERVNLAGGIYNATERTITWKEEIEVDTFANGNYDETWRKEIKIVYKNQNVTQSLVNEVEGKVSLYYPEGHSSNPGGERLNNIAADSVEVEQEYKVAKQVEKVWDDNEDTKGNRPESVTVQLMANGNTNYNGQELEKVILNEGNHWTYTYADLPKYTQEGEEIEYSVVETETNKGDLEYYEEAVITNTKLNDITDGITPNEKFTVTNKYKLMNTEMQSSMEKTGTEKIRASGEKVTYNISYRTTITDYIGEVVVKVVDTLPYKLATNEEGELLEQINLAGGTYNEETNTITWEEKVEHINTYTDGAYEVEIQKTIEVVYGDLDATQRNMKNQVTGTVDLYETEQTNTVKDSYNTKTEVPGKVIVKYVDKETGKEITYLEEEGQEPVEKTYGYEIEGLVGDAYTTEQKEIPGYTYVENSGNTTGNMIEGSIEVIYYYERTTAGGVIVHYKDEEGNNLLEDEIIGGKVGDNYETEQKEIYGYEYVKVEGTTQGKLTEEAIEVTYIYKKIPAKVIVRYLEKDNTQEDDSDNKELYPEEILEGFVGDSYTTNRKTITNYRGAEPEPSNKEGKMTKEDTYVIYYYEKIPSGTVTAKYVDIETKEEILYKEEETGEYKTYKEQMKGYVGENYQTEIKEIPYYNLVENQIPENKEGTYTQEDIEIIYYYQKQEFDMSIDKTIKQIEKDGKQEEGIDEKLDKIEIVGSKIEKTNLKITYGIKVSNTGEIEGTATVVENIPSNFQVEEGTASEWKQNEEGNLEAEVALKPGETKELTVVLSWIPGENNFGNKKNTVEIVKTSNPANYEDTNQEGDTSEAEIVMTIKTGETIKNIFLLIAIGILAIGILGIFLKWRKNAT